MPGLRGLPAATGEEGARSKHEHLHRAALPDLNLRGRWKSRLGEAEADHPAGDVPYTPTGRCGAGGGGHPHREGVVRRPAGRVGRAVHRPRPPADGGRELSQKLRPLNSALVGKGRKSLGGLRQEPASRLLQMHESG